MKSCDKRKRASTTILLAVALACTLLTSKVQSTSATQIFYPGIYIEFHCNVPTPFLQVEGINRTEERGINGYIEDLRAMGIEAKDVDTSQNLFIPTVCINGSSPGLANTTTINITCQEIRIDPNFIQPPQIIPHFILTLTYYQKSTYHLPPPKYVRISDNNTGILEWSRPPCVTESSTSNNYSISVNHTLELNYTIHITSVSNGRKTVEITVSSTRYNLSEASTMTSCITYSIEVCAHHTESGLVGERSQAVNYTHMIGCSTNQPSPKLTASRTTTIELTTTDKSDSKLAAAMSPTIIYIAAGAVVGVVLILLVIVLITTMVVIVVVKRNTKSNTVKTIPDVSEFIAGVNAYEDSECRTPPTYEQSQQSSDQQSPGPNGLIYADIDHSGAQTKSKKDRISPPAADSSSDYTLVQIQPKTDTSK